LEEEGGDVNNLDIIAEQVLERLEAKNAAREEVLRLSRQLVQHASRAIRAAHRQDREDAEKILRDAGKIAEDIRSVSADYHDIFYAGYAQDALKEFAEAYISQALMHDEALPTPDELGVEDAAWLNGLGEAVGEMRRHALDLIRQGDIDEAERILNAMQDVYDVLSTVDFPDAITGNLRRTNDMVRGVTERTRGDLTTATRQEQMKQALHEFEESVSRLRP
jgi:translin